VILGIRKLTTSATRIGIFPPCGRMDSHQLTTRPSVQLDELSIVRGTRWLQLPSRNFGRHTPKCARKPIAPATYRSHTNTGALVSLLGSVVNGTIARDASDMANFPIAALGDRAFVEDFDMLISYLHLSHPSAGASSQDAEGLFAACGFAPLSYVDYRLSASARMTSGRIRTITERCALKAGTQSPVLAAGRIIVAVGPGTSSSCRSAVRNASAVFARHVPQPRAGTPALDDRDDNNHRISIWPSGPNELTCGTNAIASCMARRGGQYRSRRGGRVEM
jgi:hypothetical protein